MQEPTSTELVEVEPNKGGRPKGSRNAITVLKLVMEAGVRERNKTKIQRVLDDIINDALEGDRDCRKLVWQSVMSKSGSDTQSTGDSIPQISIKVEGSPRIEAVKFIEAEFEEIKDGKAVE